ncbi:TIGR03086 family metal-binding protein [Kitasatospora sp. NBC_01250]|uniref:TIGR03086 family metal-binding protein n=1 Tax=unclassified Kitasatospora TaxID=2633591 RepID=UPI002E146226|nr:MULTISPECIES: TIGR03086 family metal-binding protein [unclassified Kitasatospora]WSJ68515.1 TIGR03086 family metal-binding protein [Kitasatospora sp. NBC_01302]
MTTLTTRPVLAPLHAEALALIAPLVAGIRVDRLDLPTPCAGWPLRRLLAHLIGQQYGFAAAARGDGADLAVWADRPVAAGPGAALSVLAGFADSATELVGAFAAAEARGALFALPQVLPGHGFPAAQAIGFHLLDTLVHGWDLAATLGVPFDCPPELAELTLRIAEQVPSDAGSRGPGHAFAPVRPGGAGAPFDGALLLLGRDPHWRP